MALNPFLTDFNDTSTFRYPDRFSHFMGEENINADPMITGFGVAVFLTVPAAITDPSAKGNLLTALCTSFTPVDMTIDNEVYTGRDGGNWLVPTKATMGSNSVTFKFWELVGLPVYHTICQWVSLMRNPIYGYMTDINWRQAEYKGKLMYISCTPDLHVQFAQVYKGIWPSNMPSSAFGGTIQDQAKVEFDVPFNFDHYPYQSGEINSIAQEYIESMKSELDTVVRLRYADASGNVNV